MTLRSWLCYDIMRNVKILLKDYPMRLAVSVKEQSFLGKAREWSIADQAVLDHCGDICIPD